VSEFLEPAERAVYRKYGVYFNRASDRAEAFAGIRTAQVLCRLHISEKASDALEVSFRVRHRALAAAPMLITEDPTLYPDEEAEARRAPAARVKQLEDDLLEKSSNQK